MSNNNEKTSIKGVTRLTGPLPVQDPVDVSTKVEVQAVQIVITEPGPANTEEAKEVTNADSTESTESTEDAEEVVEVIDSFDDMNLCSEVLRGVYAYGFEKPSVIQQRAILPLIKGRDLIAQSQSGTGKTGAFSIGVLQKLDPELSATQALVLAPTRELAAQIHNVFESIGSNLPLSLELSIGGVPSKHGKYNKWGEDNVSHIVIGTPGRVLDNLQRKRLNASKLKVLVLDEADEMLSRGFIDQVHNIFQYLPTDAQVVLFSATIPEEVLEIAKKFMRKPLRILVKNEDLTLEGIKQFYVYLEELDQKIECLLDLFSVISVTQSIIYANTKKMAETLHDILTREKFTVGLITGSLTQEDRNRIMGDFRSGSSRVLITTDMLARGIDVQQVSLVVNFDLPRDKETYIHRIGRSGRFGRKGVAINLLVKDDYTAMRELEAFYNTHIEELPNNIAELI